MSQLSDFDVAGDDTVRVTGDRHYPGKDPAIHAAHICIIMSIASVTAQGLKIVQDKRAQRARSCCVAKKPASPERKSIQDR